MNLIESIRHQIREQGDMSFDQFMQQALYAPEFGYYSSGLQKFGVDGDFVTAPELTPLFGQTLANQCEQIFTLLDNPVLLEFGAGSGKLCVDLLTQLEQLNCLPDTYYILEVSSNLRQRQQELITLKIPHLAERVQWLDRWPEKPFSGVIIANEVLDAMPVHRFCQTKEELQESFITLNAADELTETFKTCTNERLRTHVESILPNDMSPYMSEVNLFIEGWLQQCYDLLNQGVVLLIDYGFPRHEYYHPDRSTGTLMCHYRHHAHTNPLLHIGEQDITAHVDFTHVAEAGYTVGFHVAGYTNQASFLLGNGLLTLLSNLVNERERLKAQQAVKQLTHPSEMGELFKVIALSKQMDLDLNGFQLQDKRVSL